MVVLTGVDEVEGVEDTVEVVEVESRGVEAILALRSSLPPKYKNAPPSPAAISTAEVPTTIKAFSYGFMFLYYCNNA